jgi:hypothetical protein
MTLGEAAHVRALIAVAAIGLAAGCSAPHFSSVSPRIMAEWSFQPPRGWEAFTIRPPLGMPPIPGVRSWRTSFPPQIISLHIMPQRHLSSLQPMAFGPFFNTVSRITLCHGLPALLGLGRPPFGSVVSDGVATQQHGSVAIASYSYPRFWSPDPNAEASIRSLCPRGGHVMVRQAHHDTGSSP